MEIYLDPYLEYAYRLTFKRKEISSRIKNMVLEDEYAIFSEAFAEWKAKEAFNESRIKELEDSLCRREL